MDPGCTLICETGGEILGHRFDDCNGTGVDLDATTVAAKVSFRF